MQGLNIAFCVSPQLTDAPMNLQAVELLSRAQDATAREKELLKQVPETEVISAMIGNVKLAMPGLSKLVTEQRKGKKKKG